MDNIDHWLNKVELTCQKIEHEYIDIIIDQCGSGFSVIPALKAFGSEIRWHSLYEGLPENIYLEDAPLLVRVNLNKEQQIIWMYELAREIASNAPLMVIGSSWSFENLSEWLGQCTDANHEARPGIFRFWDCRLFPFLFSHILDDDQQLALNNPALFWSWLDRDGQPVLKQGGGSIRENDEPCQPFTLTDHQFESLMCLSDAKQYLRYQPFPEHYFNSKEAEFLACFNGMLDATKNHVLFEEKRYEWVMKGITDGRFINDYPQNNMNPI